DLVVGEADHIAQQEGHLEVDRQAVDRAPEGVDRLDPLNGLIEHLQGRRVVERDRIERPALLGAGLVGHAVLRHREEPGRELAAEREPRKPLVNPEEDLLRQILRERLVAVRQAQDVVVDRRFVRAHDDGKRALVASLRLTEDRQIGLGERQGEHEYSPVFDRKRSPYPVFTSGSPVIDAVASIPSKCRQVGARPASSPPSFRRAPGRVTISGTGFVVWAVCGLTPSGSSMTSALPWSAVTRQTPPSSVTRSTTRPSPRSAASTARTTAGMTPVCPTMSGLAKFTTQNEKPVPIWSTTFSVTAAADISGVWP